MPPAPPSLAEVDTTARGVSFDGVGGASGGGGGTRLLVDYPEQQKKELLDLLFKPQYGLSLQTISACSSCAPGCGGYLAALLAML